MTTPAERLAALDSAAISDARDRLGLPSGVAHGLSLRAGQPGISGAVTTVDLVPVDPLGETAALRRRHLCTAAVDSSGPGTVVVVAHDGRTTVAGWGGVLSAAAKVRGIEGVIVDGAVRDVDEARQLDFTVYASAAVPVTARGRVCERGWNVPVEFAGVSVDAGDWVIADGSGVVFVEADVLQDVLEVAEEIAANERAMVEQLRAGVPVSEVMGARYENLLGEQ